MINNHCIIDIQQYNLTKKTKYVRPRIIDRNFNKKEQEFYIAIDNHHCIIDIQQYKLDLTGKIKF